MLKFSWISSNGISSNGKYLLMIARTSLAKM
jgi:hypothetical protein